MKSINMQDSWETVESYDYFMGRWSQLVAQIFVEWLSPKPGLKWLDVGCGSGTLSSVVINNCDPSELTAIDQSEGFITTVKKQLGNRALCKVGDALALPLKNSSINFTVSGLVLNFISEPVKALAEMRRVTAPGGTVAAYVWDYAGEMDLLTYFWDAVVELHPEASDLHEGKRFPATNADAIESLFANAGFNRTIITAIRIETRFQDFDDYWKPFLGSQGPAPTYVASLSESEKGKLRDTLMQWLFIQADGSIQMFARAWAARSQV